MSEGFFPTFPGGGGGFNLEKTIIVNDQSQLSGVLDSTVNYFIDGIVDMGSVSIQVPQNGLTLVGFGLETTGLFSSENSHKLFIIEDTFSGNLFISGMGIEITGSGSQVFDLDNDENGGAVEWNNVNFSSCESLGILSNYRQCLGRNVAFVSILDGITFEGVWSGGITIRDTIILNLPSGVTMFKSGGALSIETAVRSNINAASIDNGSTLFDFSPSNIVRDGGFELDNVISNQNAVSLPNFPSSSVKSLIKGCIGLRNTYRGGFWSITSEAVTVIPGSNTLVKIAGTTTYSNLEWFSQTVDNSFIYDGDQEIDVVVRGVLSVDGGNNDQIEIQIRQWDDSASSFIDVGPAFRATLNGGPSGTRGENTSFQGIATLNQNDRIEVWIENISDSSNVTALIGGDVIIEERPQ